MLVVTPIGGAFSYYTDWKRRDPALGRLKWQTFLTRELPPLIDSHFHANGRNAIAGISMAGTSVFNLALARPNFYTSVAAFSGLRAHQYASGPAIHQAGGRSRRWEHREHVGPGRQPGWIDNDPTSKRRGCAAPRST